MRNTNQVWFIVNFTLGILIIIWSAVTPSMPLIPGDIWLLVPGLMLVFIGSLGLFEAWILERKLLKTLKMLNYEKISIEQLAGYTKLSINDVQELVLSLRVRGKLIAYIDPITADLCIPETRSKNHCLKCGEPITKKKFCPICGTHQI